MKKLMSINEIQMEASLNSGNANLQFLTDGGGSVITYQWIKAADVSKYSDLGTCPEGVNGIWAVKKPGAKKDYRLPAGTDAEPNVIKLGDGVQVFAATGTEKILFKGQVSDGTIYKQNVRQAFNYFVLWCEAVRFVVFAYYARAANGTE